MTFCPVETKHELNNDGSCKNCSHSVIGNVLLISTEHVPSASPFFGSYEVVEHHKGWIVFLTVSMLNDTPDWFKPIFNYANELNAVMIAFDSDGSVVDKFKTYLW